ncbi:capsule assembly Wzi family protein [uncultured Sphaerochaeta sp.]|uniref:capsule assembly Wzi family protein n=1 Tax=uncultured Sphaerochaeta sp. TaxID=886478 RepID=UPI002A0A2894|nr:capsule assembly Wzi family protein [uncultured Sphaerochaeta sp.]
MKRIRYGLIISVLFSLVVFNLFAAESLKSVEEEYYDFLFLLGYAERPTLGYRTLSDSTWQVSDNLVWKDIDLGTKRSLGSSDFTYRLYGPEFFSSYNSAYPYGQNDGALVQSKGLNASLTGGIRIEGHGLEVTFKPLLAFTQNLDYPTMPKGSSYDSEYAYYWADIDNPQRFGDDPYFLFDWGDSELRYTWKSFTIGVGTQSMWFGQSWLNPMLHSNNAGSYPKVDFGLRKTALTVPYLGYLGDIEFRVYAGIPSYSNYYKDGYDTSDKKLITGLNASYAPSFLPGVTFTLNKIFMTTFSWDNLEEYFLRLFFIPQTNTSQEDGKASFSASWVLPSVGLELYGELGIDDYVVGTYGYIRYPFHTMIYTIGMKKAMTINEAKHIYGELFFEWNDNEMSQDFQFQWPYTFYSYPDLGGYTNNGQLLGGASCPGGNSQYLGYRIYYPKGEWMVYINRTNPDNNYLYSKMVDEGASAETNLYYYGSFKATLAVGVTTDYALTPHIWVHGGAVYELVVNALYKTDILGAKVGQDTILNNFRGEFGLKCSW